MDLVLSHGYDHDGFLLSDDGGARPVLYRNLGNGTFAELDLGLPKQLIGKALVAADVDGDRDLDLFLGGQTMQPVLLRNDVVHGGHMLTLTLRGKVSNLWGLGSRVRLKTSAGVRVAEMSVGAPAQTIEAACVQFAVPAAEQPIGIEVDWPSGFTSVLPLASLDQHLQIVEPALVTLSARHVFASASTTVNIQARAFLADGSFAAPQVPVQIELVGGAPGVLDAPQCDANGACVRTWHPPTKGAGAAVFVVHVAGQELSVRPVVRFVATGSP